MSRLEAVQNIAIRSIFRLPYDNPSEDGLRRANRISIYDRLLLLGHNYIEKCIVNSNPVITEMIGEYKRYSGSRILNNCTPLCSSDDLVWSRAWLVDKLSEGSQLSLDLDELKSSLSS